MSGSVYFVECVGRIKIGFSKDPNRRVADLATSAPGPLVLIVSIAGSFQLERAIHKHLAAHRVSREWFIDCADVRFVISDLVERGPSAIGFVEVVRPAVKQASSLHSEVTKLFKTTCPRGESVAVALSNVTGITKQAADKRLGGVTSYSVEELMSLLHRQDGFDYLKILMDGERPPRWWRNDRAGRRAAAAAVRRARGAA